MSRRRLQQRLQQLGRRLVSDLPGAEAHPAAAWDCEAYGPKGRAAGALCFISEPGWRCPNPGTCHLVMAAQRRWVFRRIRELAAAGDEAAVFLAQVFTHPDQLLGGPAAEAPELDQLLGGPAEAPEPDVTGG